MLVPHATLFLLSFADYFFQSRRNLGVYSDWRNWGPIQDEFQNDSRRLAPEWQPSRNHLVKYRPKRKQIGSRVEFFSLDLLGRHIRDCPDRRSGAGEILLYVDG